MTKAVRKVLERRMRGVKKTKTPPGRIHKRAVFHHKRRRRAE